MTDLSQPPLATCLPDKRQVAASFSRAAPTYDSVAAFQRDVGERLLASLPTPWVPSRWLDLGCGTGHFSRALQVRFGDAQGLALDLAEGMLHHARAHDSAAVYVAGDAESLPLRDASVDLVFSSLAIQWCARLDRVLAEASRVLRPGGVLAFSSLCVGTLAELRASWQAVDGHVHVNRFRDFQAYEHQCLDSGLEVVQVQRHAHGLHYPDLRSLTHELKALGAHNLNPGRPSGLTGRARIAALRQAYERLREPAGLPVTYQVVYAVLRKSSNPGA